VFFIDAKTAKILDHVNLNSKIVLGGQSREFFAK